MISKGGNLWFSLPRICPICLSGDRMRSIFYVNMTGLRSSRSDWYMVSQKGLPVWRWRYICPQSQSPRGHGQKQRKQPYMWSQTQTLKQKMQTGYFQLNPSSSDMSCKGGTAILGPWEDELEKRWKVCWPVLAWCQCAPLYPTGRCRRTCGGDSFIWSCPCSA